MRIFGDKDKFKPLDHYEFLFKLFQTFSGNFEVKTLLTMSFVHLLYPKL